MEQPSETNILEVLKNVVETQKKLMQNTNRLLQEKQKTDEQANKATKGSIPLEVKRNVRVAVTNLPIKWDFTQSFRSPRNEEVNKEVYKNLKALDNMKEVGGHLIQRAIKSHFLGKRRNEKSKQNGSHDVIKQRERRRHRRNEKLRQRKMATEKSATFTPDMKYKIKSALVLEAMSPEHSSYENDEADVIQDSDNEEEGIPQKKVIKTLPLSWRSTELTYILESLDRKTMRRKSEKARSMVLPRMQGEPVVTEPPQGMPQWTVKTM